MTNKSLITTWENAYSVSLGCKAKYEKRLKELESWDRPIGSPGKDVNGQWREWSAKKTALRGLIQEADQ